MRYNMCVGRLAAVAGLAIVAGSVVAGAARGQWLDNFNRNDGPLGGSWTAAGGLLSDFSISDLSAAHSLIKNSAIRSTTAASPYQYVGQTLDISKTGAGTGYVALAAGYGGTNNLFIKLQGSSSVFDHIGFYSGLNDASGWPGSTGFEDLFETFSNARVQLFFVNNGEKLAMSIDTDLDGRPDATWLRSGVKAFSTNFGTGMGIGAYGDVKFDNWRVMPTVLPPADVVSGNIIPFGANLNTTMHQVFRSGLYSTPMRINSVWFFPAANGRIHTNLDIEFGYTRRLPGLNSPSGLSIPSGPGGAPNAMGSMYSQWTSADVSVNLTADNDIFPFGLGSDEGFVYFPGIGNLLLEVNAVQYSDSVDMPMWRSAGSSDSSRSYTSTTAGSAEDPTRATRLQYWAMPYLPDVLPTRPFVSGNGIPFNSGTTVNHQVHHFATLAHLADGGDKVAIQGIAYAPTANGSMQGQLEVRMGYTLRQPEAASPAGLDIPVAGGGGGPNASGPMSSFFSGVVNRTISGASSSKYLFDLHQQPFVYDWTKGNLLIETQIPGAFLGLLAARADDSAESSRAFRTARFGNGTGGASKIKFITTPVREHALPEHVSDGTLLVPFGRGTHVTDQVFSAAQFGADPVRIDSIAFAPMVNGVYGATDVTVRLGYTARHSNQGPPSGLSVPNMAGDGDPNAAMHPMTVFRSGAYAKSLGSASATNFQIELQGDVPFLYNPAMGDLLLEISSVVPDAALDVSTAAWDNATQDSSIALSSTRFASANYPNYAPIVQFSYFKDLYPCVADLTGDGAVDLSDFFAFFNCFDITAQCADVDSSGSVDLGDFFAFFNSFDAGC